jgi:hypothetical protein
MCVEQQQNFHLGLPDTGSNAMSGTPHDCAEPSMISGRDATRASRDNETARKEGDGRYAAQLGVQHRLGAAFRQEQQQVLYTDPACCW